MSFVCICLFLSGGGATTGLSFLPNWALLEICKAIPIESKYEVIYQASTDGFGAADFHRCVDGKGATLTSDNIASFIESKGTDRPAVIADDKYQKWSKANEGKDEIDFFIEKYSGLDDGLYVINKKAFQKQGNQIAPVSLDSIIG